jgi:DNA mismatch repair protein MutS
VGGEIARLQAVARRCAELDALAALAEVAAREGYVRPVVDDGHALEIVRGRHPVVERMMPRDRFVPNDVTLTPAARLIILTGPNMAGKSTILRQIGLIVLMAQMGSYVPAASARIGVADRVFTRVGASDNLVRGQSTFMVEMAETSAILHTATARSLVLLDEIGRGTATWDGLSIAWAVSEHLHERVGCKTVFATHYHELTQLADEFDSVRNFNVAVQEAGDRIVFLHRLMEGGADRSYGIEVGRLAGLPDPVIARARALLRVLEGEQIVPALGSVASSGEKSNTPQHQKAINKTASSQSQLGLFALPVPAAPNPVVERLAAVDINALTPLQALALIAELAAAARGDDATEVGPAARPR